MKYEKMNNLFLRQSYLDSWEDYERSLKKKSFIKWDYIILTASNKAQATAYRNQIENRLEKGLLPEETTYAVLPDPEGKRVGSGGATFQVMRYIAEQEPERENPFKNRRILVIHSGGDSKRVPQYSAIGKLFSPVSRELPDGRSSTLFDEFIVGMSGVPSRIQEGMLVLSGDVLLLFNPLQIDAQLDGAAAISIKEPVATGKNHGVFLNDGHDYVKCFLHKQTEERLREMGAVNKAGNVDLDTGAVLFGSALLQALFRLISTEGKVDEKKFRQFCNEEARISFYGDFLYPLANDSTLEDFYKEAAEGQLNEALHECRTQIWNAIHHFSMKLLCLSPAEFIHFGTTRELRSLVTKDVQDYEFLDWKMQVNSAVQKEGFAAHNAYVGSRAKIGKEAYLENCYILGNSEVGDGTVLSHVRIMDRKIPEQIVMHGIELTGGKKLWMNAYSQKQFLQVNGNMPKEQEQPGQLGQSGQIQADEAFLEKAGPGEYCFVEDKDVVPYESRIEEVILCHWNRDYPADMYFKMDLGSWKLAETQEYAGSSHEKITEERYVRR